MQKPDNELALSRTLAVMQTKAVEKTGPEKELPELPARKEEVAPGEKETFTPGNEPEDVPRKKILQVESIEDVEDLLAKTFRDPDLTPEERFSVLTALTSYVTTDNLDMDVSVMGRYTSMGMMVTRAAREATDMDEEGDTGERLGSLWISLLLAAEEENSLVVDAGYDFLIGNPDRLLNRMPLPGKNALWNTNAWQHPSKVSNALRFQPVNAIQAATQTAPSATLSWGDYIKTKGQQLLMAAFGSSSVLKDLDTLINNATADAEAKNSVLPLTKLIDTIIADIDKYASAFGRGFQLAIQNNINSFKYNVYFLKGLICGLYEAATSEETKSLLGSVIQVVVVGLILNPVTGVVFIAGTLGQILYDLYSFGAGLWGLFTNLGEIAATCQGYITMLWNAFIGFLNLPHLEILKGLAGAAKTAGPSVFDFLKTAFPENPELIYEQIGHFIGATLFEGTVDFFFKEAKGFSLLSTSLWDNLTIYATYFFNWGRFIGPLILEIIVSAVTGVGTLELIGKNGAKLLAKYAPKLIDACKEFIQLVIRIVVQVAGKMKDTFFTYLPKLSKLINKGVDLADDAINKIFEWTLLFCEPADIIEFILSMIAAVFEPGVTEELQTEFKEALQ